MPLGGPNTLEYDWVVYQMVAPRIPDGNDLSFLKGTREMATEAAEVDGGTSREGVDRSKVRVLERVSQYACTQGAKESLTAREDGSKTYASPPALRQT